jgi:hypothetical protein
MRLRAGYVIVLACLAFGGAFVVQSAVGGDGKSKNKVAPIQAPARVRGVSKVEQGPALPGLRRPPKRPAPAPVSAPAPPPAPSPPTQPVNTSPPPVAPAPAPRFTPRPAPRKPAPAKPKPIPFDNSG